MPGNQDPIGIAGHVGRSSLNFALVDGEGRVMADTIRGFGQEEQPTVSGGISTFLREVGMTGRSVRAALAVAGVARGDAISITNSPWFVSRSGLGAMLGHPPIILNDFAARAWALTGPSGMVLNTMPGFVAPAVRSPGVFCLIGIGLELGVAAFVRGPTGLVTVISSEAGATVLPRSDLPEATLRRLSGPGCSIESYTVLSGSGLVRLAGDLRDAGSRSTLVDLSALRAVASAHDKPAQEAVRTFCDLFWNFAINLVLTYGAWDGVILTGELSELLKRQLVEAARVRIARKGSHARLLRETPIGIAAFTQGELAGASMALRAESPVA